MLRIRARKLRTVYDVQMMVGRFIDHMVAASVDALSWSGLAQLDPAKPYLFISNHRDITLDSALLNRVLHEEGFPTCQIAVGDNLFGTPHADDLMRLNRGFLVERSATGPKATYRALLRTSSYIRHSIETGASVWIAQREGRAKDGFDRTEPALIKMLALAWRSSGEGVKPDPIQELLQQVQIVPVAISYELDPCDLMKTDELHDIATQGCFVKDDGADLASITKGMRGYKGRVHVHFAAPLVGVPATADDVAAAMDRSIVGGLKVYPPNTNAWAIQQGALGDATAGEGPADGTIVEAPNAKALSYFTQRLSRVAANKQPYLLMQYANLLRNRYELGISEPATAAQSNQQTIGRLE